MAQSDLQRQQAALAQGIKKDMLKIAAAQTMISIGLSLVPIVGWALGAIASVVQIFTARAAKKDLQHVIDDLKRDLAKAQKKYQLKYEADQEQVYEAERIAVVHNIKAGESMEVLSGLGFSFSSIGKSVTKAISKAVHKPVKAVISTTMKATAGAAKAVGAKSLAKDINRSEDQFSNEIDRSEKGMADRLQHPYKIGKDVERLGRIAAGTEAVHQARIKAREFLATAEHDMAAQVAAQHKILHSIPFRQNLRNALVTRMNEDPNFRKLMFSLPSTLNDPLGASVKVAQEKMGTLATVGAIGAAAIAFLKLR